MRRAAGIAALSAVLLAACAGGSVDRERYRDGTLRRPLGAQPGDVVAAELGFARTAQEKGQWTAFAEYATDDAVMFVPEPVNAQQWLKGRANPAQAVKWQPHQIWSSCDGTLAVTKGAWQRPDGSVGYFTTVWQRQEDGDYKWVMDQGDVLAEALAEPEMVKAEVADCTLPAPGKRQSVAEFEAQLNGAGFFDPSLDSTELDGLVSGSDDGSLVWAFNYDHPPSGRLVVVVAFRNGAGFTEILRNRVVATD